MLASMFFKSSRYGLALCIVVMVIRIDISQEIIAIDVLTALKSSLGHRRKHTLRSSRLYMKTMLKCGTFSLVILINSEERMTDFCSVRLQKKDKGLKA